MKVVILAGGAQSTLSNRGEGIPKPMIEIGGKPLLWHIMKHFSEYGIDEFIICGGYRVDMIKDYFMDFYIYESDITVDLQKNTVLIHKKKTENWKVTVVDTGLDTELGLRIKMVSDYIDLNKGDNSFIVTYGDCLSDVNVTELVKLHNKMDRLVTMVMAKPRGRKQFLSVNEKGLLDYSSVDSDTTSQTWICADCFVMNKKILEILNVDNPWETRVIENLSRMGMVATYKHEKYWTSIETLRDLLAAEKLWSENKAPWISE